MIRLTSSEILFQTNHTKTYLYKLLLHTDYLRASVLKLSSDSEFEAFNDIRMLIEHWQGDTM